jgi:hypothetical protein
MFFCRRNQRRPASRSLLRPRAEILPTDAEVRLGIGALTIE